MILPYLLPISEQGPAKLPQIQRKDRPAQVSAKPRNTLQTDSLFILPDLVHLLPAEPVDPLHVLLAESPELDPGSHDLQQAVEEAVKREGDGGVPEGEERLQGGALVQLHLQHLGHLLPHHLMFSLKLEQFHSLEDLHSVVGVDV